MAEMYDEGGAQSGQPMRTFKKKRKDERVRPAYSSYVLYLMERRDSVANSNPTLPLVEVSRVVAAMWRAEPEHVRLKYGAMAEADKRRYVDELRAYEAQRGNEPPPPAPAPPPTRRVTAAATAGGAEASVGAAAAAAVGGGPVSEASELIVLPNDPQIDPAELYCRACQQYFVTAASLRDHISGRRHKLVVGEPVDQSIPDIPIFTKEFLQFNQSREQEMRVVRRAASQFEEQTRRLNASKSKLEETLAALNADAQRLVAENAVLLAQLSTLENTVMGSMSEVLNMPVASAEEALVRLETLARNRNNHALIQAVLVQLMDNHGKRLQPSQGLSLVPQPGTMTPSAPGAGPAAINGGAHPGHVGPTPLTPAPIATSVSAAPEISPPALSHTPPSAPVHTNATPVVPSATHPSTFSQPVFGSALSSFSLFPPSSTQAFGNPALTTAVAAPAAPATAQSTAAPVPAPVSIGSGLGAAVPTTVVAHGYSSAASNTHLFQQGHP